MTLFSTRNQNIQHYENIDQPVFNHMLYLVDDYLCQPLPGLAAMEGNKP